MHYRDDLEAQRQLAKQLHHELKVADEQLFALEEKDVQKEEQIAALTAEVARLKNEPGEAQEPQSERPTTPPRTLTAKQQRKITFSALALMQHLDDSEAQRQRIELLTHELQVADEQLSAHVAKEIQDEE